MRIALVCNAYPPEFLGGSEMVVAAAARELKRAGHEVRVVCGSASESGNYRPALESVEGIEVQRIERTAVERGTVHWQFARLVRLVDEATRGFDLVHVHHWSNLSGDLVRRLARRVPVVLSLHDHFASCPRFFRSAPRDMQCPTDRPTTTCARCVQDLCAGQDQADLLQRLLERWKNFRAELQAAACVIAPSESLQADMAREMDLSPRTWEVVPHGLCQELVPEPSSARDDARLNVLSFGNRTEVKGTLDLVQALASLPAASARLILPGAEVEAGFDDRLRAAAGDLELEFPGPYNAQQLATHAARADLAAFPSWARESYGLVVEEALALGLPVWVSERGALGEVLTRCAGRGPLPGGILPAQDPASWHRLFAGLVESPHKLQDARRLVPEQPRPAERAVGRWLELYATLLDGQPAGER